jgi:glutamyl-tRNA reductase
MRKPAPGAGAEEVTARVSELLALGVSHKTAPLDLRERLSLTEGSAVGALQELTSSPGIHEAAAISTCNRTELYLVVSDPVEAESTALGVLTRQAELRPTELLGHLYSLRSGDAARQLFRVTAGLDSMIVGEAEIQGQVKRAYELALVEGGTGPILNRLFRGALAAGGRVREETSVGEKGVSVPSVAVELARRTLGDLGDRRVLVVGAGETAELVARALVARGVASVFVANRHYDRAIGLAQRFGGDAVRFEELPEQLEAADIVVSATNSPHHIVERNELEQMMATRRDRPLLLVDIAVPRDIEPACRGVAGVSLHDIDDVQQTVERNASGREAEANRAEPILAAEQDRFERWLASLEVMPTVASLRERGDEVARRVLAENEGRWQSLEEADRERLAAMAKAIVSRLLHEPTLRMKRSAGSEDAYAYVSALRELFGLDVETEPESEGGGAEVTELRRTKPSSGST